MEDNGEVKAEQSNDLLTPAEAAAFLRVSKKHVLGWIKQGRIPGVRRFTQRTIRIPLESLEEFERKCMG